MTQRQIAAYLGTSVPNINLHIASLKGAGVPVQERKQQIQGREGARSIRRSVKQYPIDVVHAIAVKARRLEKANQLRQWARRNGVRLLPLVVTRAEVSFARLLQCLSSTFEVLPQYRFGAFAVDFFVPVAKLVIEFDEKSHSRRLQQDTARQRQIEQHAGVHFIRVAEGNELEGLSEIIKLLFRSASRGAAARHGD